MEPNSTGQTLQIVQITDTHLGGAADFTLQGVNCRESLDSVLELVQRQHPDPDLVLVTGDIAQDGSAEAYRYFQQKMQVFKCPVFWLAGNHDDWPTMLGVVGGLPELEKIFDAAAWRLIFLDSAVPDQIHGFLPARELDFLDQALAQARDRYALVCLHHHPVDTSCQWLNGIGVHNRRDLFARLDGHPQVRGLLWGHVHQEMDQWRGELKLMATPSTCFQFEPGSRDFRIGSQAPGYRWLELQPDGGIETGVIRTDQVGSEVGPGSKG